MKNNFYFWRHTNSNIPKFQLYLEKIDQLCSGDISGLDIEKLHGTEFIFSLRLDHAARLIFTYYKDQVCLLELLDNHQYQRCRFIDNPQLVKYVLNAFARSKHICEVNALKDEQMGRAIALELHQNQFIQFSEQQEKIFEASLPLVVSGPAGSGKTCMAISMISNAIQLHIDEACPQKMIYVTKSPALALQLKNHWQDIMPEVAKHLEIEFVTYAQLLPAEVKLIEDEETHFKSWVKEVGRLLPYPIEFVWQEFRIISGVDSFEQYAALGRKQCLFNELSEKQDCYDFYQAYQKYLKSSGLCSPSLFKLAPNPIYDLMVIDEAQDLSHCQLANLNGLAKNAKIVYFLGDHQLLFDFKSKLNFIKQMYHDAGIHVSPLVLTQSYRCPPQVVELANCLIQTKYLVTGGLADSLENPIISIADGFQDKVGQVRWIDPKNELLTTEIQPHAQNHYFAVIVMDDKLIPEAADFFQCEPARVFTPESIKGLEFKMVVLWRPLIGTDARDVSKLLPTISFDDEQEASSACAAVHRPKAGHGHEIYLHFFNRLITAVTRCQQTLIWVESEQHRPIEHLISRLKKGFEKSVAKVELIEASKQEDWQQLVVDYFYQDNIQGAQDIFNRHLQADYSNFEHFCQMHGLVRAQALEIMPAVKEVPVAAVASCSAIVDYSFANAYFNSKQKKEDWSYKSEIQEIIEAEQLPEKLGQFLMKFKSGAALDNFLFKEKCIKVAESRRKINHYCFIDFLKDAPSIWLFVSELASHTQLLAKMPIKKLKKYLGEQHKIIPLLNNLEPIQELLYQQLDLKYISEEEVLNPGINFPVIHFLLKLKRLNLLGAVITAGAPLEALDQHGQCLLHAAALNRDYQSISTLYQLGFDINTLNQEGHTIGFLAATLGDRSLFETLNACDIDWYQKQSNPLTPFQQAVRCGQLEMVDLILTHQPKPLDYINLLMPFHIALSTENPVAMCKKLLSKKLDPLQEFNGEESFFEFLMRLDHFNEHRISILTDLKDSGLSLETWTSKKSFNLAHLAARHDRVDVIDWLVTYEKFLPLLGASKASSLPIEEAIKSKSIQVLQKLISLREAGGFKPDLFEKLAILAMFTKNPQMIKALHEGKLSFDFLVQKESLIHFAVRLNSPPLIEVLSDIGVDINQPNEAGLTPFLSAAKEGKIESLYKLEKLHELNIDAQDIDGNGIIHILAIHNQCRVLEDFLFDKKFCELALRTNFTGYSPFCLGVLHNHLKVAQIFLNFNIQQSRSEDKNLDVVCLALQNDNADMLNLLANFKFDIYQSIGGVSPISISITDNRPACCKYLLKDSIQGTASLGKYFSPLFMIASLGKTEFLTLLKEISYNFYQTNELGENILHVLMQSDLSPTIIKSFVCKLKQLGVNINHLLFQLDVHKNDPMFYFFDKNQLDLILYFEDLFKVLWPISQDEVDTLRKLLPEDLTEEDVRVVSTYGFCNPAEGLAAKYFRQASRTGQIDIIQWLVECYQKLKNHTQPVQNFSMFVRKHGDLDMVLWDCIFIAIEHGQLATLHMLSKLGVPIDRLDSTYSYTSLECAIRFKQLDIFKFIASQSKLMLTKETYTVVHSAAMYDACDILRLLYSKVALRPFFTQMHPIDGREPFEEALPVMVAAGSGSLNALKTLKNDCGADIFASVSKDYDAMWFSMDNNYFNQDILEYLVTEGCDVNKEYDAGKMTLLMKTATTGQFEALPILLGLGAKLDWMCLETKRNILLYCVANNQVEYLKKLMAYPIDLTHVDCNGFNALHVAIVHSNFEIFQWMLSQPKFQMLIHMTDTHGRTPMHLAKFEHEPEMLALLEEVSSKTQLGFFQATHESSDQTDSPNANQP